MSTGPPSKDRKGGGVPTAVDNNGIPFTEAGETPQVLTIPPGTRSTPDSCRETLRINHEEQAFHHHLTLGLQEKLQKNRMIRNVKTQFRKPVDKQTLSYWERKNGVILPTDLKQYFQSTNGFKLTWSLEHAGDVLPIGELGINPINQLLEIHQAAKQTAAAASAGGRGLSLRPKTCSADSAPRSSSVTVNSLRKTEEQTGGPTVPFSELEQTLVGVTGHAKMPISGLSYNPANKTFILDGGRSGWGKVCLVYPTPPSSETTNHPKSGKPNGDAKSPRPAVPSPSPHQKGTSVPAVPAATPVEPYVEIWFLDPSFQWHYLAPTFTHFYRMLLFHLGLPQWQYRFTPFGLSAWAEQMFWLVAPHLLQPPKLSKFPSMYHGTTGLWCTDVPTDASTPNPTLNVLTNQLFRRKKNKEKH